MTLATLRDRLPPVRLCCSLVALALSACAGDPFVSFDELPATTGGGTGGANSSGASAESGSAGAPEPSGGSNKGEVPQPTMAGGGNGTGGSPTASAGAGGSAVIIETNEGGAGGEGSAVVPAFDLIDDVEGNYPNLPQRQGRNGLWYMIHDYSYGQASAGAVQQLNPQRPDSHYAARVSGSGFTDWGAQLGVTLKASASGAAGYDASRYCGVRFMAKGIGPHFTLLISDRQSVPQGGVCGTEGQEACYRFVGKTFEVGADWEEVQIGFSELDHILDPSSARALDPSEIYDILFNFYSPEGKPFELLVDDLSFIEKTDDGCLF